MWTRRLHEEASSGSPAEQEHLIRRTCQAFLPQGSRSRRPAFPFGICKLCYKVQKCDQSFLLKIGE